MAPLHLNRLSVNCEIHDPRKKYQLESFFTVDVICMYTKMLNHDHFYIHITSTLASSSRPEATEVVVELLGHDHRDALFDHVMQGLGLFRHHVVIIIIIISSKQLGSCSFALVSRQNVVAYFGDSTYTVRFQKAIYSRLQLILYRHRQNKYTDHRRLFETI